MAARSIASLTVSFGLVSIPVKLYSATEASRQISFNLLHKTCGSRLRQQYFCIKEDVPVPRDEMVKGYEFAKDQYVMFSPEELKAMEEAGTHAADIDEFVPLEKVDPVYFDKAYYLAPDKGGAKPYALFQKALLESNRCAIGRWAARGKQYIVMIRPVANGLVMQQLLYADAVQGRGARARREGDRAEGRRPRDHHGGRARRHRRTGHRPHGSAAREPREEGRRQARRRGGQGRARRDAGGGAQACEARDGRASRAPEKKILVISSLPRRREPSSLENWIPAFAGMTIRRCISTASAKSRRCCACRAA